MFTQRLHLTNQDANQVSATQLHRLGSIVETADGRVFRYTGSGAVALAAGVATVTPAKVANHTNITVAAAVATTGAGNRTVTATLGATAATLDQYAGGYLVVNDAAGAGGCYRIQGNSAAALSTVVTIQLSEAVAIALTTSSKVSLVPNPWYQSIVHPGGASTFYCSGFTNTAVAASSFYWSQTAGMTSVLSDGIIAKGTGAILTANAVPGAVTTEAAGTVTQRVGIAPEATVDTKYYPIYATVDQG